MSSKPAMGDPVSNKAKTTMIIIQGEGKWAGPLGGD